MTSQACSFGAGWAQFAVGRGDVVAVTISCLSSLFYLCPLGSLLDGLEGFKANVKHHKVCAVDVMWILICWG